MKSSKGITLVALVITVILLLILVGITISYSIGNNGTISHANLAKKKADIARIQETLELEKVNLVNEKNFNVTLRQYIEHITKEGIIGEHDKDNQVLDSENVDYGSCYIKVEGKYYFKIEDDEKQEGNLQITYVEKLILVNIEETIEGTTVKVVVTPKEGTEEIKEYEYYIKQKGETKVKKETNQTGEYTFTGLKPEQSYWIEVKVIGKNGEEVRLGKWITIGKDEGSPTASITIRGGTTQANLPVRLQADVKQEDEISGINIQACKYVLNKESKESGLKEEDYTGGAFTSEEETIELELNSIGEWYLHILTVDNANNKIETIQKITVQEKYHIHIESCYGSVTCTVSSSQVDSYRLGGHACRSCGSTNTEDRTKYKVTHSICGEVGYYETYTCTKCWTQNTISSSGNISDHTINHYLTCKKTEQTKEGYKAIY